MPVSLQLHPCAAAAASLFVEEFLFLVCDFVAGLVVLCEHRLQKNCDFHQFITINCCIITTIACNCQPAPIEVQTDSISLLFDAPKLYQKQHLTASSCRPGSRLQSNHLKWAKFTVLSNRCSSNRCSSECDCSISRGEAQQTAINHLLGRWNYGSYHPGTQCLDDRTWLPMFLSSRWWVIRKHAAVQLLWHEKLSIETRSGFCMWP